MNFTFNVSVMYNLYECVSIPKGCERGIVLERFPKWLTPLLHYVRECGDGEFVSWVKELLYYAYLICIGVLLSCCVSTLLVPAPVILKSSLKFFTTIKFTRL